MSDLWREDAIKRMINGFSEEEKERFCKVLVDDSQPWPPEPKGATRAGLSSEEDEAENSIYPEDQACNNYEPDNSTSRSLENDAIQLIADERKRQIEEEGWTCEYDDLHKQDQLPRAASCYCLPDGKREFWVLNQWPFSYEWWKPTPDNRIRELVKAGALIVAEIERLQRIQNAEKQMKP